MCSYITEKTAVTGSGKGPNGWFQLSHATVYLDHPYFTPLEHTLNIDFINQADVPSARVAVELSPESARELVARIQTALRAAEEPMSEVITDSWLAKPWRLLRLVAWSKPRP
jgi:hypothetical protein